MTNALPSFIHSPVRGLRAVLELGNTGVRLVRCVVGDHHIGPLSIPLGAPDTFETPVHARRAVAFAELDMALVRVLKDRFDSTINDVVLAVCSAPCARTWRRTTRTSRARWSPSSPCRCAVTSVPGWATSSPPCSCRSPTTARRRSNGFAPSARPAWSCKGQERAVGYGPMATLLADAVPPALAKPAIQLGVRSGVLRKLRAGNLMVSNVPGPTFPLYFAGMQLRGVYPLGPVVDGVAVNVTVQSYRDSLFVGINACAVTVPDPPGLARAMVEEVLPPSRMAIGAGERRNGAGSQHRRPAATHVPPARSTGRSRWVS